MKNLCMIWPILLATFVMSACAAPAPTAQHKPPCRQDCEIEIRIPTRGAPEVPPDQVRFNVAGGTAINFKLTGQDVGGQGLLLVFEEAAFVDRHGQPLYWLHLKPGNRTFTTAQAPACAPGKAADDQGGCKYTIVDLNDATREVLDPWIIIF